MMEDLISVVMCVYNTEIEYLKEAIDSILNQTYKNIEFIIVNDGSTKREVIEILEQYKKKDHRIRLITNNENVGLTVSLNKGFKSCNGKYIARMDADDISLENRLEKQKKYLDVNKDVALIGSDIICFGDGEEFDTSKVRNPYEDYETYKIHCLFHHSGPPHPTFMFRGDFLKKEHIKYRGEIKKAQDYGIMVDVLKKGGIIKKLNCPLLKYRIHSNQITASSTYEQKIYQLIISYDYIRFLFDELSDSECLAMSMMGCELIEEKIANVINNNYEIRRSCNFDINNIIKPMSARFYINAQKRIFKINRERNVFNNSGFKREVSLLWFNKVVFKMKNEKNIGDRFIYVLIFFILKINFAFDSIIKNSAK